ncbi:ABC transporter substrate-binding protein [Dictyobacter kobayashii]|uniref:Putative ABC transporter-binding protein n=1 Tax=Dictyobacter kobayashii TaxID=2014872 RepID=A0A402AGU0_9CHLR|nr:ABC transporter substrate-binding protein [Dictyobacter kobayashii]GCE18322.1 putative ABC transporter-binding protein [Dictyobacter kobayashii]
MIPEQREALDTIVTSIRSGRMTRRTFLERAMAAGLSGSVAVSLLEACGGSSDSSKGNGAATNIVWQSEQDSTMTYQKLTDTFNKSIGQQQGIHVTWNQGPSSTDDMLSKYTNMLRARNSSIDVMSIDIVYPAQFAASQWTRPITDSQWPASERSKYLPGPIQGCTFNGKIWAAPFRTDVGLLYYRTDLISTPPRSWDDLTVAARSTQGKVKYGYVWQGAQYEGLVCNFCEVVYGYGGSILDASDPKKVTVNSPEARAALEKMVSWVGTISPTAVTTYLEDPSRQVWQNGDAAFMRNWPYAYTLGRDPSQSKVAKKFDVHSMPYGGNSITGHSAIGGWNLAINAYSSRFEQSWQFIKYLLQPAAQKQTASEAGLAVTRLSTYDDADVLKKNPLFGKLKPILQAALPRPVSPKYTDVSDAIQRHVYQALKKQVNPAEALKGLEADLKQIVTSA